MDIAVGRLATNLRADANGRPFRTGTVDQIFDPRSIVTDPVTVFNPNDPVVYVFLAPASPIMGVSPLSGMITMPKSILSRPSSTGPHKAKYTT